jgi:hypothetical protein
VQQIVVRKGTDEALPKESVVKGYEYGKDRFVAIEPEELKSLAPKTSTSMEIQEFVKLEDIDPVYFETSYYINPEEAGDKGIWAPVPGYVIHRSGGHRPVRDAHARARDCAAAGEARDSGAHYVLPIGSPGRRGV